MADIIGTPNNDTLTGRGPLLIDGGLGNDWLSTLSGASTLQGGEGADTLMSGGDGARLEGGDGNDYLIAAPAAVVDGTQSLSSRGGEVTLVGGGGDDIYGVRLQGAPVSVTIEAAANMSLAASEFEVLRMTGGGTLASGSFSFSREGADLWVFNHARGSSVLVKDNFYQLIDGGKTYSSIDLFEIEGEQLSGEQVLARAQPLPAPQLASTEGDDRLLGSPRDENLTGLGGNDVLRAGFGHDTLAGGLGADTLEGGAGNDLYFVDNVGDVVSERSAKTGLDEGGVDTVSTNLAQYTLPTGVEALAMGGKQNMEPGAGDWFTAKAGLRHGVGNDLNNLMTSGGGTVFFEGGKGADRLVGSDGNDTLAGSYYTGTDVDAALDDDTSDTLVGGAGNDTYALIVADPSKTRSGDLRDTIVEQVDGGIDTVITNLNLYVLPETANLENLISLGAVARGNEAANQITGSARNNELDGRGGNDTLIGSGGRDSLYGGEGNDLLQGSGILYGGQGDDSMQSSDASSNDQYVWGIEDGRDVIEDAGGTDWLELRDYALAPRTTRFQRVGDDLSIASLDGANSCTMRGWFAEGATQRVEYIVRSSGGYVGASEIEQMVALWATVPALNQNNPDLEGQVSPAFKQALADLWQAGFPALDAQPSTAGVSTMVASQSAQTDNQAQTLVNTMAVWQAPTAASANVGSNGDLFSSPPLAVGLT